MGPVAQRIVGVALPLAVHLQCPLLEHQPQQLAVMLAAALAVANDEQPLVAVSAQQVVEVDSRNREQHASLVPGGVNHAVELALEDHARRQLHTAGLRRRHVLAQRLGA